ncbi:MAG: orotidine 5'-phosphate decarboxylase [uncultured bacterium]|uniref:Orotidine-5'-phosphate decarboxylase n=1 Tax=Candidatus Curtissbacteria bacterium RIFOXYA1_FULL_41_14 TaxID=1797737 RepID=A0A1F5HAH5_9BACT|nr:MAG: orotidine 5'-phosphate decarboxylase [uncultured bacterium]KKR64821.1 MAG: Orotidine 5'-phosphate decarboxylase [Candidatus Curtissbacteria bacterium GW2011_GWA1_40_47]KKR77835.1 MAG: Orotidine 5'-phosphate decarboxylase [Candidatus Curtissbacteria bacterium GW2011_GWD1_40_8]KKS01827.1 MAG: Orotidine 5'-phosphate decarboxylase [Candidatus Curtissbacteria bacterium GW2011_GWC2_41_21]OGD92449.1 MAG: orotidine 5'-phosphate decarboxylase [Candidatus Curtissbacteria bacterium RIFCSPHIGHO2_12
MKFKDLLEKAIAQNNSLLCVGLDPEPQKFSKKLSIFQFNKSIIDQTSDSVCAYKPNSAFYEAQGIKGLNELKKTITYLKKNYPTIPVVLDAKRADIPNTARMYAKAAFEYWEADAVTVYPYLGLDSILPFLQYKDKLTILLIKTSNPGADMFQNLKTKDGAFYLSMAKKIKNWKYENIGIFVGATFPKELAEMRKIFPDRIFLSAGVGAQSAEIKAAVKSGIDKKGAGIMFNASRSIIYGEDPGSAARQLRDEINKYR